MIPQELRRLAAHTWSKRSSSGCCSCCRRTRHPLFAIEARYTWDCRSTVFITSCLDNIVVPRLCVTTLAHPQVWISGGEVKVSLPWLISYGWGATKLMIHVNQSTFRGAEGAACISYLIVSIGLRLLSFSTVPKLPVRVEPSGKSASVSRSLEVRSQGYAGPSSVSWSKMLKMKNKYSMLKAGLGLTRYHAPPGSWRKGLPSYHPIPQDATSQTQTDPSCLPPRLGSQNGHTRSSSDKISGGSRAG